MNSRSFRKGHGRSSSDVPFDFNLQQNCETNSIELKTSDKDGLSPWGEMTGKLIKKSIHTVGELARVPTKVLRGSAPITETFNFNFNSNSNSNSNANWSTTVPSDERKSRSGFLGNHSTKGISNNNNNNNNNNFVQNNGNQFKIKEGEFLKPGLSTYPLYSQISAFPENQLEHIPALQTIPIPSFVFSNINFDPKTVAPSLPNNDEYHCPIFMIVGPDDGIFECINEIPTRRQQLKQMKQNLIINNNNNNNNNNQNYSELSEKEPILMEDLKKKLGGLNKIEKKLKKLQFILNKVQNDKRERTSDSRIYGQSTDSYAYDYIKSTKAGQPNCDSFFAQTFDNNICFCVADGIGWGGASRRAAQSALLGFMIQFNLYLYKSVCKPTKKRYGFNTLNFAKACKESIYLSQLCVYSNSEAKTTMAGGIVAPLFLQSNESDSDPLYHSPNTSCSPSSSEEDEEDDDDDDDEITFLEALKQESKKEKKIKKKWVFVGFSVGDSLIYRYSSKNQEVVEVSSSDRSGGMRDAGGNLGGSSPDLSNLQFYCCLVEDGDFLIAVSDGVHDNLDPEVLKLPPHSNSNLTWAELSAADKTKAKKEFKEDKLLEIIEDIEDDNLTSSSISNAVIDYVMRTTSDYREAYELGSKLQRDWGFMDEALRNTTNQIVQQKMKNPVGKFDHVTCLTVKVGFGHPCKFS